MSNYESKFEAAREEALARAAEEADDQAVEHPEGTGDFSANVTPPPADLTPGGAHRLVEDAEQAHNVPDGGQTA